MTKDRIALGSTGPEVFPLALGCMGLSGMYGQTDDDAGIATIEAAIERGVELLDTGDLYGMGHNVRGEASGNAHAGIGVELAQRAFAAQRGAQLGTIDAGPRFGIVPPEHRPRTLPRTEKKDHGVVHVALHVQDRGAEGRSPDPPVQHTHEEAPPLAGSAKGTKHGSLERRSIALRCLRSQV